MIARSVSRPVLHRSLIAAGVLAMVIGVLLRLWGLDFKAYGNDEATTSLRTAGATIADYRKLFDGTPRTVEELRPYQNIVSGTSLADVHRSLAVEDPQHPPLFYDLLRGWLHVFDGIFGHRSLAVVFGVVAMAAIAWLVFELTGSYRAATIALAFNAVSPYFVLYSQQAREYSLWAALTAATTALIVRDVRLHTVVSAGRASTNVRSWILYALLATAAVFSDLLFVGVLAAHAIAVFIAARRSTKIAFAIAASVAFAVFAAFWLPTVLAHGDAVTNNAFLAAALPAKTFLAKWLVNLSTLFSDIALVPAAYASRPVILAGAVAALISLVFIAASLRVVLRGGTAVARAMLCALIIVPTAMLVLPDILHHESRSTAARYLVPLFVGLAASTAIFASRIERKYSQLGTWLILGFVFVGAGSAVVRRPVPAWWTDWSAYGAVVQADAIQRLPEQPARIAFIDTPGVWDFSVMELVNRLPAQTQITLYRSAEEFQARPAARYLLDPAPQVRRKLQQAGYRLQPLTMAPAHLTPALLQKTPSAETEEISLWEITAPAKENR